jgi:hypothetical protein
LKLDVDAAGQPAGHDRSSCRISRRDLDELRYRDREWPMQRSTSMRRIPFTSLLISVSLLTGCVALDDDGFDTGKADGTTLSEDDFWGANTMYFVRIADWDPTRMTPDQLAEKVSVPGSEVRVYRIDPANPRHCPDADVGAKDLVYATKSFNLRTSGNMTKGTPKSSYKIGLVDKKQRLYDMKALNLRAMWNDVSQMREALAWSLFREAGVRASRHTYARLCINDRYYGLYSMIEDIDKPMLKSRFGKQNDEGNLYKAEWADLGPATLEHRRGPDGDDSGRQYFVARDPNARTYALKTNEDADDDPARQTYDDLATLIRVINGVGLPGGDERFATDAYRQSVERVFNVKEFLRWASVNILIGAWDNYWRTPSNYFLYDSGRAGADGAFMTAPYFSWLPHDYDNTFGIDFFGVPWQQKSLVNWESAGASLPLVRNLLRNETFLRYYLDSVDHMLDCCVNERWIAERIGEEGTRGGLWERVRHGAFLESETPTGAPHTGRRWTNDQVFWNGFQHHELRADSQHTLGILHFVRMREANAREQLRNLRVSHPRGASGARFPVGPEPLPN